MSICDFDFFETRWYCLSDILLPFDMYLHTHTQPHRRIDAHLCANTDTHINTTGVSLTLHPHNATLIQSPVGICSGFYSEDGLKESTSVRGQACPFVNLITPEDSLGSVFIGPKVDLVLTSVPCKL